MQYLYGPDFEKTDEKLDFMWNSGGGAVVAMKVFHVF